MKLVVLGYHDMGHACLEVLLRAGHHVSAVFTHANDPAEGSWFASVERLARKHGLPVHRPTDINAPDEIERIRRLAPDLLLSFCYRQLVEPRILTVPRIGCFNLHPSLLPRLRGRCPVNWALIRGERETGVSLHEMVERADAGAIVGQHPVPILDEDDALTLHRKLVAAGVRLFQDCLPGLLDGTAPRTAQDLKAGSYVGRRTPEDGRIDWTRPAREIHDLVRGVTHPFPGARTVLRERRLFVWRSRALPNATLRKAAPGRLLGDQGLVVATGRGALQILRCQLEGEPEMDAVTFARRYGIRRGALLGEPLRIGVAS